MKALLFGLALFASACTTMVLEEVELKRVDTNDIGMYAYQNFTNKLAFFDEWYSLPTVELVNEINVAWKSNIRKYVPVTYDCDDFADEYQRFARDYVLEKYGYKNNLAVFKFCFMHKMEYPHAINVIFCEDVIVFVEPQTGKLVQLSAEEQASCFRLTD